MKYGLCFGIVLAFYGLAPRIAASTNCHRMPANLVCIEIFPVTRPALARTLLAHLQKINVEISGSPHGGAAWIASTPIPEILYIIITTLKTPTVFPMICSWLCMLIHTTRSGPAHWARD